MKASLCLSVLITAVCGHQFVERRAAAKGCGAAGNTCQRGLGGAAGNPPLSSRLADCSRLNTVTVIPATVTVTRTTLDLAVQIPTGLGIRKPSIAPPAAQRADATADTTIFPTATPTYATYCAGPTAYYNACSCAGAAAATTTLPAPTETVTTPREVCIPKYMLKRAMERMGFEPHEDMDLVYEGIRLF